ncbi:MAG: hypothetical protein ACI35O_08005 [Bacillaceae bacterium]
MKTVAFMKYRVDWMTKQFLIFYSILLLILTMLSIASITSNGTFSSSGLDLISIIFIFVMGIVSFKESFYFSQANHISRKSCFNSFIFTIIPFGFGAGLVEVVINRLYNLFVSSPMNVEMIYSNVADFENWVQTNDVKTLVTIVLFQGFLYIFVLALGFLLGLIYYRLPGWMKAFGIIGPIAAVIGFQLLAAYNPSIIKFMDWAFGITTCNPYAAVGSFTVGTILLLLISQLLMRKVTIKDK